MHPHPRVQRISSSGSHLLVRRDAGLSESWIEVRNRFLAAIPDRQRPAVESLLRHPHLGGRGIRAWLSSVTHQRSRLPAVIPDALMQVYLEDDQAVPLHDCASCGVAIPVRPAWDMPEEKPEQVYFSTCPCCGGSTGLFAYWTRLERESHTPATTRNSEVFSEN